MLQAQSYSPALIYVEAGEAVTKHMAVSIQPGGKVLPSNPSLGLVIGFALQDAEKGEFLPVQVDGVLYGYGYTPAPLSPGSWYYQGVNGELTLNKTLGGHIVGFAVTESIFRIFITGSVKKPEIVSGAESLEDLMDPYKDTDVVDGSGSLSEAIENGWDTWDSIGYDGSLSDMFSTDNIESGGMPSGGGSSEGGGGGSSGTTDDGLGIVDGGSLDSLFSDDGSYLGEDDSTGGNLDLGSLISGSSEEGTADGGSLSDLDFGPSGEGEGSSSSEGGSLSNLPSGDDPGTETGGSLSDLYNNTNDSESGSLSDLFGGN